MRSLVRPIALECYTIIQDIIHNMQFTIHNHLNAEFIYSETRSRLYMYLANTGSVIP